MPILELKIDSRIAKNTKEFESIFDKNKLDSLYNTARFALQATKVDRGGAAR